MGSALTTTSAERQQALQQLKITFGQPNGSMIFTYNGGVVQTTGINADGTLNVMDMQTGVVTTKVDPVDIYSAARAISNDPVQTTQNTPKTPSPLLLDNIMQQIGMYSGLITTAAMISKIASLINMIPGLKLALGVVGLVVSLYSTVRGAWDFWDKPSWGALGSLAMSAFGVATAVNLLIGSSFLGPVGWAVAGAVILATWAIKGITMLIKHIFGLGPSPEQQAMTDLNKALTPLIWAPGPVIFIGAGVAALLMGWPKGQAAPIMSQLTLPQSYVTSTLSVPGRVQNIIGASGKGPAIFVGADGNVIMETPAGMDSHGNSLVQLNSYQLTQKLQFVAGGTPSTGYIPFFIYQNGKPIPNPALVKALAQQNALLTSVLSGGLTTPEAQNAILLASTLDKYGVSASAIP